MDRKFGDFSFRASSFTVVEGQAGTVRIEANFEGHCSGFGVTLGTMTLSRAGQTCGIWTWCATNFPDGGESVTGTAQGSVSDLGGNRWRTQGLLTLSDERECLVEGELDLAARSWKGYLSERS